MKESIYCLRCWKPTREKITKKFILKNSKGEEYRVTHYCKGCGRFEGVKEDIQEEKKQ